MNRWQRAAAMVGVVLVLFAVGRMLTPFSTRVILNPRASRATIRVEPCGITLSEATKAASVRTDKVQLTAIGEQQKAAAGVPATFAGPLTYNNLNGLSATATHVVDPFANADNAKFDHVTVTTFSLSPCESAARRRLTSAGVLIGLALVGVLAALVLLRDGRQRLPNNPVEVPPHG